MSCFCFIDRVAELRPGQSVTAFFKLKGEEEFLRDHFPGFPVMPGVLLLETLKQAAAAMLPQAPGYRLRQVESVKFGQFVKPGAELEVRVRFLKKEQDAFWCRGEIDVGGKRALVAEIALVA